MGSDVRPLCPRCGQVYSWIERSTIGGRVYFYAVHYLGFEGGRRKTRKCYLGPAVYEYVSRTHENVNLTFEGAVSGGRLLSYLEQLAGAVETVLGSPNVDKAGLREVLGRLRGLVARLEAALGVTAGVSEPGQGGLRVRVSPYVSQYGTYRGVQIECEGESTLIPFSLAERLCRYGVARVEFCAEVERLVQG